MAYGSKRGIKTPGDYNFMDLMGLGLAGSTGIVAALITDYRQKGEASALYTINQWASSAGDILGFGNVPLWSIVAVLVAVGGLSIFYFQPITRQGAFAQGFGLLAVIMTAVPADLAGGLQPTGPVLPDLQPVAATRDVSLAREAAFAENSRDDGVVYATFAHGTEAPDSTAVPTPQADSAPIRAIEVQETRTARYVVELNIVFPRGVPSDVDGMIRRGEIRGRLHNEDTKETFNLFRTAGGDVIVRDNSLVIRAGVPARSREATLWVRIEADGYTIEEQSAKANLDNGLLWTINLRPSSTPLFIQRLGKSYWF